MRTVKLKLNKTFEEISDPALDLVLPVVVSLSTADFGDPTWVIASPIPCHNMTSPINWKCITYHNSATGDKAAVIGNVHKN